MILLYEKVTQLHFVKSDRAGKAGQFLYFSFYRTSSISPANDDQGLGCRDKLLINSAGRGRMLYSSSSLNLCYLTCHSYLHLEPRKVNHHSKLQWISHGCIFFSFFQKGKMKTLKIGSQN